MVKILKLTLITLFFLPASQLQAVPAYPYPVKIKQPGGSTLTVILRGDEFHKYYTTEDDCLIAKDSKGVFNYAELSADGKILSTGVEAKDLPSRSKAELSFIENLNRTRPTTQTLSQMRAKEAAAKQMKAPAAYPTEGSPRSLVILVNFSDLSFAVPNPASAFNNMLNQEGYSANGASGSARDYFQANSMNVFSPEFDVVGPVTLPQTFKFYGENNASGADKNPVQMVVDACTLAAAEGVDFSYYDTNNDGIVDNIFIYYAGYNEAEWGGEDTVWPHSWGVYPTAMYGSSGNYSGTVESVIFNGKRIESYACSSELRGNSGTEMCGIGTFVHEFSHVIGLADMYPTNEYEHFTLSYWNVMDFGVYLNKGRTPPAYNAFERFQLGFLKPQLLTGESIGNNLEPLISSNQAYLISETDYHNLNGTDPSPTEFFLLENRQKTGWDAFLPGHGMLVYRINYNASDWSYNRPNNNPDKMGVQLMSADSKANGSTLSGDPFPGTSNVTSFDFISRTGKSFNKGIREIVENGENITFSILTPLGIPTVPANAGSITTAGTGFSAVWESVANADSYLIDVYTKTPGREEQLILSENFSKFTAGQPNESADTVDISSKLKNYTATTGWTGSNVFQAGGSVKIGSLNNLGYLALPVLDLSADNGNFTLKFDAMAWSGDNRSLNIFINGQLKHTISNLDNTAYIFSSYSIPFTGGAASTIVKFEGNRSSKGRFFLDNVEIIQKSESSRVPVSSSPFSASASPFPVENLEAGLSYFYTVKAVNETQESSPSVEVGPISLTQSGLRGIVLGKLKIGSADKVIFFEAEENEDVEVFNLSGQKIYTFKSKAGINRIPMQISGVVIVKVADRVGKVVL